MKKYELKNGGYGWIDHVSIENVYKIVLEDGTHLKYTYAALGYIPCDVEVPSYPGLKFEG